MVLSLFSFSAKHLIASENLDKMQTNEISNTSSIDDESKSEQEDTDAPIKIEDSQTSSHLKEFDERISRSLAGLPPGIQEKLLSSFYLYILNFKILVKEKKGYDDLFDPENQSLRINLFEVFDTMMRELKTLPKQEFDPKNYKFDENIELA